LLLLFEPHPDLHEDFTGEQDHQRGRVRMMRNRPSRLALISRKIRLQLKAKRPPVTSEGCEP
jgi:hypothetical protein